MNVLIIGGEQSGKTTLMDKLVRDISPKRGFLTRETSTPLNGKKERVTYFLRPFYDGKFQGEIELGYVDFSEDDKVEGTRQDFYSLIPILKELSKKINGDLLFADEITPMDGNGICTPFYDLMNQWLDSKNSFIATMSPYEEMLPKFPYHFARVLENHRSKQADTMVVKLDLENRESTYSQVKDLFSFK